jgi:hypothetical protein
MKLTGISVKDFLIIKDLSVPVTGRLSVFAGKNGAGKTSVLKAIQTLFKGSTDSSLIRNGADKAEIIADIDGIMKIRRTIRKSGTQSLDITREDGMSPKKPQTYLDGLIGDFSFDPVAFILDADKRQRYLMDLCAIKITADDLKGVVEDDIIAELDFRKDFLSVLGDAEKIYMARRRDINKDIAAKKVLYDSAQAKVKDADVLAERVDITAIEGLLKIAERKVAEAETLKKQAEGNQAKIAELRAKKSAKQAEQKTLKIMPEKWFEEEKAFIKDLDTQIAALTAQRDKAAAVFIGAIEATGHFEMLGQEIASLDETLAALTIPDIPDVDALKQTVADYNDQRIEAARINNKIDDMEKAKGIAEEQNTLTLKADAMTAILEKLRSDIPESLAAKANMPIKGLRFSGDKIFVNDNSVDNMSTSELIDFAVSVVTVLNSKFPIKALCLDRAESLDDETLKLFAEKVPEDWQFFLTYVQHGIEAPDGAFILDGGEIKV